MPIAKCLRRRRKSIRFDDDCRFPDHFRGAGGWQRNAQLVHGPDEIELTDDALFAFGYYAGDGYSSDTTDKGRFVSFCGNQGEKLRSMARCERWLKGYGVYTCLFKNKAGRGAETRCYSSEWARWFRKHFGPNARSKHLPQFALSLDRKQSRILLSGLLASDGYKRRARREYSTMSPVLAAHVMIVMIRAGHRPCVTHGSTGQMIVGFSDTGLSQDALVRKVTVRYPYKPNGIREKVYDLTVARSATRDAASFVVGFVVVHNCHRIGQRSSVLIQHLVVDGSLDARAAKILVEKQEAADRTLNPGALRAPVVPRLKEERP